VPQGQELKSKQLRRIKHGAAAPRIEWGNRVNYFDPKWRDASKLINEEHILLDSITQDMNKIARHRHDGDLDTCILTSHALAYVLGEMGYDASPIRVTAAVFPDAKGLYGTVLGSEERRSVATMDMWGGRCPLDKSGYSIRH
jgi:hypothetical protein